MHDYKQVEIDPVLARKLKELGAGDGIPVRIVKIEEGDKREIHIPPRMILCVPASWGNPPGFLSLGETFPVTIKDEKLRLNQQCTARVTEITEDGKARCIVEPD